MYYTIVVMYHYISKIFNIIHMWVLKTWFRFSQLGWQSSVSLQGTEIDPGMRLFVFSMEIRLATREKHRHRRPQLKNESICINCLITSEDFFGKTGKKE